MSNMHRKKEKGMHFKNGVSFSNLEEGAEFEIDREDYNSSSDEDYFEDELSNSFKEKLSDGSSNILNGIDLSTISLEELKSKMTPLTEDKLLLKLEMKAGVGKIIPTKAIVYMHYNAYIENCKEPYDSTYLRGNSFRVTLGIGSLVNGLEIGISTMKKGEISRFWFHYDYAYGTMGCPPRIPAKANIMYHVEIVTFIDSKDALEYEALSASERKSQPFEKVYSVCKLEHSTGNEMFGNKKYSAAVCRYRKAVSMLEEVSVADKADDDKRHSFLLKLYNNLCMSYLQMGRIRSTIFMGKKVLDIDRENTKAMYRIGRAYMLDNDFENARKYFLDAKKRDPYNSEINSALLTLEQRSRLWNNWERDMCKKVFGSKVDNKVTDESMISEFAEVIDERVQQFISSSETEYTFQTALTSEEIDIVKKIAQKSDLFVVEKIYNDSKILKLKKKVEST